MGFRFLAAVGMTGWAVGMTWLLRLPALIAEWKRRWSLSACPPFTPLRYGYVAPAKGEDGARVVLSVEESKDRPHCEAAHLPVIW